VTFRRVIFAFVTLGVAGVGAAYLFLTPSCAAEGCPLLSEIEEYRAPEPPLLYDRHGRLVGALPGPRRVGVSLDEVPEIVREGFVAVEDRRFRSHPGVDLRAALRALYRNLRAGEAVEGASTIPMQLARNVFGPEIRRYSKWRRKAVEVRLALELDARLTKERILELYLNQIYLGDGAYGIGAASRHYFGVPVSELELKEAALLIGMTKNPEGYDPRRHLGLALERRDRVLEVLVREGVVDQEAARRAREAAIEIRPSALVWSEGSYYAAAVRRELRRILPSARERSGVRVHTGLDPRLQSEAERALLERLRRVESGAYGPYRAPVPGDGTGRAGSGASGEEGSPYLQGMVVALDPGDGAVRALVGGRDFVHSEFDRALQARRQPGSAFKPVVYAAALAEGRTLAHLVPTDSLQIPSRTDPGGVWHVGDPGPTLDGEPGGDATRGHLTIREALVRSSNAATVRLGMGVGVERVIEQARALGISGPLPPYPSLLLGTAEVVPAELVAAYAAFGNGGFRVRPHLINRIEDSGGRVLWETREEREPALDPRVAHLTLTALQEVVDRGTGRGVRAAGYGGAAAGKTGTTDRGRDLWFVGLTPGLAAGVWIGFDRPRSVVAGASGGRLAAPVWARVAAAWAGARAKGEPGPETWRPPESLVRAEIDETSGFLAHGACPGERVRSEWFLPGTEPVHRCPLHERNVARRFFDRIRSVFGGDDDRPPPAERRLRTIEEPSP